MYSNTPAVLTLVSACAPVCKIYHGCVIDYAARAPCRVLQRFGDSGSAAIVPQLTGSQRSMAGLLSEGPLSTAPSVDAYSGTPKAHAADFL